MDIGRWRDGPLPGDVGPAVLVGHVDLNGRPGVFGGLSRLGRGDLVDVSRPDGRVVRFRVTRTLRFSKEAFPTDQVYEPTDRAELRLVTCGGSFNRLTGHYRDNVVVFATAA
jgi:sortase (surface protein transpeptidase)